MRIFSSSSLSVLSLLSLVTAAACSSAPAEDVARASDQELSEKNAKIVDDVSPTATVTGTFDPRVRVYGYVVSAKAGAKVTATLSASAGADARRQSPADPLDTQITINGPYTSKQSLGKRLAQTDDGDDGSVNAPPASFTAERDGNYLVTFTSFDDTGSGSYKLALTCEGTDFQCQRPNFDRACTAGQLFVQGAQITGNTTWDQCEVILLESATVVQGATLTIQPGVIVKGNYLGTGGFGSVNLNVEGLLQAVGTKDNPVAFTSLKADRGWGGIVIKSPSNSLQNVVIEKARVGVNVQTGGSVVVTDAMIQGVTLQGERPAAGIQTGTDVEATFTRALVKGFTTGLWLQASQRMTVQDSVVRENGIGMRIEGANPLSQCWAPPAPPRWRDPIITNTDIINNEQQGVLVYGSDVLVQISKSNIVGNKGIGVEIQGGALNPQSYFRQNNVFDNGNNGNPAVAGVDVRTYHSTGVLDISGNYWKDISDPELSANWQRLCNNGAITFTGFSPVLIADAGPRKETLIPPVKDGCWTSAQ
jgi:hypothetical protein